MLSRKTRLKLRNLPTHTKLIGIGSFIALISCLLPWYEDQVRTSSEIFLGITGPLYLIGFIVLLTSGFLFALFILDVFFDKKIKFPFDENHLKLFLGSEAILLLIIALSVFHHPKFGFEIIVKEVRFGLFTTFLGLALYLSGVYMESKPEVQDEKPIVEDLEKKIDLMEKSLEHPVMERETAKKPREEKKDEVYNLKMDI